MGIKEKRAAAAAAREAKRQKAINVWNAARSDENKIARQVNYPRQPLLFDKVCSGQRKKTDLRKKLVIFSAWRWCVERERVTCVMKTFRLRPRRPPVLWVTRSPGYTKKDEAVHPIGVSCMPSLLVSLLCVDTQYSTDPAPTSDGSLIDMYCGKTGLVR